MGIDDGGNSVCRVMKSIDKFKPEGDKQGDAEQDKGKGGTGMDVRKVGKQVRAGIDRAPDKRQPEDQCTDTARSLRDLGFQEVAVRGGKESEMSCGCHMIQILKLAA